MEMKVWCKEMLAFNTVEYESSYTFGEEKALKLASDARDKGGAGFLMIDAAMARNQAATIAIPNHWVVFKGDLSIDPGTWWLRDSGHYRFKVYTWAKIFGVSQSEGHFEDNMFGSVYGW